MSILTRLERARSSKRITVLSLIGIVLVPLVVAGILVWALFNPQDRLDQVTAAIVNEDEPVQVEGQTVPLGRQLSAGLVDGGASSDAGEDGTSKAAANDNTSDTNYAWKITDADEAREGLTSGKYVAVVTIPKNFSKAATSFGGDAADAEQATIDVATSKQSRLVDDAITQTISSTAANLVGNGLTTSYLQNVYVGFNTLGTQLGQAADGAQQLATGTDSLRDGAVQLADGVNQLAAGTPQLTSGASQLASGAAQTNTGAQQLANGLNAAATQVGQLPAGIQAIATGSQTLADGVQGVATGIAGTGGLNEQLGLLSQAAALCTAGGPGSEQACQGVAQGVTALYGSPQYQQLVGGVQPLADGAQTAATQIQGFAGTAPQLASGIQQLAAGSTQLANGTAQLSTGASGLSTGLTSLADGVTQLGTGATGLADGSKTLADSTHTLADGLDTAVQSIPSYSESDRDNLAKVVSQPVTTDGAEANALFGTTSMPFYAVLALWLGALATFIVLRAIPSAVLSSTRSSLSLAVRTWLPAGLVGILQGLLVSAVMQPALKLDAPEWIGFAAIAMVAGAAFAAANQALIAVFGGFGRFISMIVTLVTLATGIIATVPDLLDTVFAYTPVHPALNALRAMALETGGVVAGITGIVLWLLLSLVVTTLAIARRRSVSAAQLRALGEASAPEPSSARAGARTPATV
jgi:putative membrane protein